MTELKEILLAREEREMKKKELCKSGKVLISMNLNVPGFPKTDEILNAFFFQIYEELTNWLKANRLILDRKNQVFLKHAAGDFYLVPVEESRFNSHAIKEICEQFEIKHPLGRFIDVDVTDETGTSISSGKLKTCFLCNKHAAIDCRRNERHKIEDIRNFQLSKIKKYLLKINRDKIGRKCSSFALQAILMEISLTPKPGLVDLSGSGIHTDMDFNSFLASSSAISLFFTKLFNSGFNCKRKNLIKSLPVIREIGLQMENEMFAQTGGVNTQKGLIFLMGISLFASGYMFNRKNTFHQELFIKTIQQICKGLTDSELHKNLKTPESHGEICFHKFGIGGSRAEAENGFPTVFNYGLPILIKANSLDNKTLILCLLSIMSELDDTNVLYRSDIEILENLKTRSKEVFENYTFDKYKELIEFCSVKRISPGGAADLLSISVFIYLLNTNFQ